MVRHVRIAGWVGSWAKVVGKKGFAATGNSGGIESGIPVWGVLSDSSECRMMSNTGLQHSTPLEVPPMTTATPNRRSGHGACRCCPDDRIEQFMGWAAMLFYGSLLVWAVVWAVIALIQAVAS